MAGNLPALFAHVRDRHSGDLINLFSSVTLINDAEAGLIAASLEAIKRKPQTRDVIYVINQRKPCGLLGAIYTCLEAVAASKAGIEDIWLQQHDEYRSGREIAAMLLPGNQLVLDLYDNSALVTAHVVKGPAEASGFFLAGPP